EQVGRAGEERDRGRNVAARGGAVPGGGEVPRRVRGPLDLPGRDAAELRAEDARLLEVVARELVGLPGIASHDAEQPPGEAFVQLGTRLLRQCLVGSVADQLVAEPELLVAGEAGALRPQEVLADEVRQAAIDLRGVVPSA